MIFKKVNLLLSDSKIKIIFPLHLYFFQNLKWQIVFSYRIFVYLIDDHFIFKPEHNFVPTGVETIISRTFNLKIQKTNNDLRLFLLQYLLLLRAGPSIDHRLSKFHYDWTIRSKNMFPSFGNSGKNNPTAQK